MTWIVDTNISLRHVFNTWNKLSIRVLEFYWTIGMFKNIHVTRWMLLFNNFFHRFKFRTRVHWNLFSHSRQAKHVRNLSHVTVLGCVRNSRGFYDFSREAPESYDCDSCISSTGENQYFPSTKREKGYFFYFFFCFLLFTARKIELCQSAKKPRSARVATIARRRGSRRDAFRNTFKCTASLTKT